MKERVSDVEALLRALEEVAAGGSVIDPKIVESLVARRAHNKESLLSQLSGRELDVLSEMAEGKTNTAIARRRSLAPSTVEEHVTAILSKLGLNEEADRDRRVEISEHTFGRWRNPYGGMKADDAKELRRLRNENGRLKRMVADQALDIEMLKEVARGNFRARLADETRFAIWRGDSASRSAGRVGPSGSIGRPSGDHRGRCWLPNLSCAGGCGRSARTGHALASEGHGRCCARRDGR